MADEIVEGFTVGPPFVDVSWEDIGKQLLTTLYVQVGLNGLVYLLGKWFHSSVASGFRLTARRTVGVVGTAVASEKPPKNMAILNVGYGMQWLASCTIVVLWVYKTYIQRIPDWLSSFELVPCAVVIIHFFINVVRNQFDLSFVQSVDTVLDVITITPLVYQSHHRVWLSFSFLRSYRVVLAYLRLEKTGVLDRLGEVLRGYFIAMVKFAMFLFTLAAVTYMLEVLGDFSWLEDSFTTTNMGDISMYQMIYWMMTTISTVGYGDYSPTTIPSRFWIFLVIPAGVVFFTIITGDLIEIRQLAVSGRGEYYPKKGVPHVVVCGGAVVSDSSATIDAFLAELLHPYRAAARPEVVLVAPQEPKEWLSELLSDKRYRGRVSYIRGHPLSLEDAARAKLTSAEMVFVMGDIFASTADLEDEVNVYIASVLITKQPDMKLRLMLLRPENRELAVNLGVRLMQCFAINEIKATVVAQMCCTPGFTPFVLNLFQSDIVGLDPSYEPEDPITGELMLSKKPPTWLQEYTLGTTYELYGCQLSEKYVGLKFPVIALKVFNAQRVHVLGFQDTFTGSIVICPMTSFYEKGQVVFVAATEVAEVDAIRQEATGCNYWKVVFRETRDRAWAGQKKDGNTDSKEFRKTAGSIELGRGEISLRQPEPRPKSFRRSSTRTRMPFAPKAAASHTLASNNYTQDDSFIDRRRSLTSDDDKSIRANRPSKFPGPWEIVQSRFGRERSAVSVSVPGVADKVSDENCSNPGALRELTEAEGHAVIILQDDTLWQQLVVVINLLRSVHLHNPRPIIVLSRASNKPPPQLVGAHPTVVFFQGDPQKLKTLLKAGVVESSIVVVLAGRPSSRGDELDMDRETLMTAALVEKLQADADVPGLVVLDMHDIRNITQLRGTAPPSWSDYQLDAEDSDEDYLQPPDSKNNSAPNNKVHPSRPPPSKMSSLSKGNTWLKVGEQEDVSKADALHLHPRFCAGHCVSRAELVRLFGFAFYTPGVLEVAEALVDPERRQQVMRPTLVPVPQRMWGHSVNTAYQELLQLDMVLVAVRRAYGPLRDSLLPYTVSFPYADMVLMPQDGFYVIVHQDLQLTNLDDIAAIRQEMQDVHKDDKDHDCEEQVDAEARIPTMSQQPMQSKTLFV